MIEEASTKKREQSKVDFSNLSDTAFVRINQIVGPLLPVSRSTWWRYVKSGKAPLPVKLGAGVTAWNVGELRKWLARAVP
jgi:prophage regulatory protein